MRRERQNENRNAIIINKSRVQHSMKACDKARKTNMFERKIRANLGTRRVAQHV